MLAGLRCSVRCFRSIITIPEGVRGAWGPLGGAERSLSLLKVTVLCESSLHVFFTVAVFTAFTLHSHVVWLNNWTSTSVLIPKPSQFCGENSHLCQELIVAFVDWSPSQTYVQFFPPAFTFKIKNPINSDDFVSIVPCVFFIGVQHLWSNSFSLKECLINVLHAHINQFKLEFKHFGLSKNNQ